MPAKSLCTSIATALGLFAVVWLISGDADAKTDRRIASDRARAYISAHPELPANFADAIRSNEIVVGMTMEQVVAAWGRPAEIQKFRDGRVQHWFFGCDWPHDCEFPRKFGARELFEDPNRKYQSQALFENGVVVKWWS